MLQLQICDPAENQASSWSHPRKVVFKIEKPYAQIIHLYTLHVTTLEMEPYQVFWSYCGRGRMENFIKEGKSGFDFATVSSSSRLASLKLLKISARVVKSARYKYFKLCSICPYKKGFYETLENIRNLHRQLE